MKTFKDFMMEAEGDAELSNLRRQINDLRRRGRPGDEEKIAELTRRASELVQHQKVGDVVRSIQRSDESKPKSSQHTWTSGKPRTQKGGEISSVGTQSNVSRQRITDIRTGRDIGSGSTPGENVSGLHGDTRSRSQKGGSVPTRNKGQGRVRPERGNP